MSRAWWSVLQANESCASCGIPFVPGRGESVGGVEVAVYASALLGLLTFVASPVRAEPWAAFAWIGAFGLVFPLATYRHFRGAWVGVMYAAMPWGADGDPPRRLPDDFPALPWDE